MSTAAALSTEDETVVAAFDTVIEAEMARGRLEVEGIPSRIVDGNTVGIAAHLSMALGGAKVVVGMSDLEAARTILFSPSAFADEFHAVEPRVPEEAPVTSSADADASRALKAAIFGLVFVPPVGQLWSLVLLGRMKRSELTTRGKRAAVMALVIDATVLAIVAAVLSSIL